MRLSHPNLRINPDTSHMCNFTYRDTSHMCNFTYRMTQCIKTSVTNFIIIEKHLYKYNQIIESQRRRSL
jgi:hypothetical protein